jgi:exopolyphosphatase/guanosine-5'-triphosphate,3'-diphosphate pyrophosphatase
MTRVAAIDCGTNSIRLLITDVLADGLGADVHREMRIVRLGQGVDATGRLVPEAIARTREALTEYAGLIGESGAQRVRLVATSATRDAANRDDFFDMTRDVLGVPAEVITGDEEARLSFAGAVADLPPERGPFVVADVGGGSTEVVFGDWDGREVEVRAARSVDIGCVRLTERCLPDLPPTPEQVAEATRVATAVLAEVFDAGAFDAGAFDTVPVATARTWVGVAGTATTLTALNQGLPEYDATRTHLSTMSYDEIDAVTKWLLAADSAELAGQPVIHPGRRDVLGGGAIVVRALADALRARADITELLVSEKDILDGIALSLG